MVTQASLEADLRALGIRPDALLTVHTSLKAVGPVAGPKTGADAVLDALLHCVDRGMLLIPAHTFRNIREDGPVFDIRRTMPCIGTLPRIAVGRANDAYDRGDDRCRRSCHVSHSVVAFGAGAAAFTEADRASLTRTPMTGSYGALYREGGKILLLGVDLSRNTFLHAVDEAVDGTVYGTTVITVTDYDGSRYPKEERITRGPAAANFPRFRQPLEQAGAVVYGKAGCADAMLIDARRCFDTVYAIRKAEV